MFATLGDYVWLVGDERRKSELTGALGNLGPHKTKVVLLLSAIRDEKPAGDIIALIVALVDCLAPRAAGDDSSSHRSSDDNHDDDDTDDEVEAVHRAWERAYYDSPLDDLKLFIGKHNATDVSTVYAKTVVFVQSSGMGKSRLVHEFGRSVCPMISFCLRRKGNSLHARRSLRSALLAVVICATGEEVR